PASVLARRTKSSQAGSKQARELHHQCGRHIGRDAERENRQARERAAREHIGGAERSARLAVIDLVPDRGIDAGQRDVSTDAENEQRAESKRDAPPEFRVHLRRPRSFERLISPSYWCASR